MNTKKIYSHPSFFFEFKRQLFKIKNKNLRGKEVSIKIEMLIEFTNNLSSFRNQYIKRESGAQIYFRMFSKLSDSNVKNL